MPMCASLGITAETTTAERVELSLEWSEALCTSNHILHGGAIMALADSAGGSVAFFNLPHGATGTSTIESKTTQTQTVLRPRTRHSPAEATQADPTHSSLPSVKN